MLKTEMDQMRAAATSSVDDVSNFWTGLLKWECLNCSIYLLRLTPLPKESAEKTYAQLWYGQKASKSPKTPYNLLTPNKRAQNNNQLITYLWVTYLTIPCEYHLK